MVLFNSKPPKVSEDLVRFAKLFHLPAQLNNGFQSKTPKNDKTKPLNLFINLVST